MPDRFHGGALLPGAYVPGAALRSLALQHVRTVIDPSVAVMPADPHAPGTLAGYTGWAAPWGTTQAWVSWRWAQWRGTLIVLTPAALSTNIVVMEGGGALAPVLGNLHIFERIETLPWREVVGRVIARLSI